MTEETLAMSGELAEMLAPPEDPGPALRLSKAGACARQLAFRLHGHAPLPDSPEAKERMARGHEIERWAIDRLREEGLTVIDQQREVSYLGVPGHIDGRVSGDRPLLLEIKSMKWSYFDAFCSAAGFAFHPWFAEYRAQLATYLEALGETLALVVAVLRPNPTKKNPRPEPTQWTREIWQLDRRELVRVSDRFARVRSSTGPTADLMEPGKRCEWCSYRDRCDREPIF